ncbi:MAG: Bug family tripartite tricarboxylate transporter substrate binding protein [Burkholderiales bacterium]
MRHGTLPLIGLLAFSLAIFPAHGQSYPTRPIKIIIDTAPGGVTDILGRLAADGLTQKTGQSVVAENRAGASGVIAVDHVVKSPADGYTLMFAAGGNIAVQPFMSRALPYDPVTDIVPVFNVAETPHLFVIAGSLPIKSLTEFVAFAKASPGKVFYGSAGIGSPPHLSLELFSRVTGISMVHVPYKGLGNAMPDMLSGRLQLLSISLGTGGSNLKSGAIRALAVGADKRLTGLPDTPTSAEAGIPGWKMSAWFGLFTPKGTPPEVIRTINERMQSVLDEPKTRQRLIEVGAEPAGGPQAALAERMRGEFKLWGQVIQDAKIKLE